MSRLLPNKTAIPPCPSTLVERARLIQLLNQGCKRRLTLISASAGYGKTSLLSQWARQCRIPVYWLTLDESDNDPVRFLTYLLETLVHLPHPLKADIAAVLQTPQQAPSYLGEIALTALLKSCQDEAKPFMLVLDDYHAIQSEAIHHAVTFILEQAPSECHLAIATRHDPPLPLARLKLEDQLCELRNPDLCFTDRESAEFFSKHPEIQPTEAEIARLTNLTEGWIAGIKLVALSLGKCLETEAPLSRFKGRNRDIFDYLSDELLNRLPEETKAFLLKTSLLQELSASLCASVTGNAKSQEMLETLEKANLFIVPLDQERHWYRFHHLFSSFLLSTLEKLAPSEIPLLHRRAAVWYEQNKELEKAIGHYLEAKDFEQAEKLIELSGKTLLMRGEATTLKEWIGRFPESWLNQRPALCLLQAWSLTHTYGLDQIEGFLDIAEKDERYRPQALAVRTILASLRGERVLDLAIEAFKGLSPKDTYAYHLISVVLGYQYAKHGLFLESIEVLENTANKSWEAADLFTNVLSLSYLAQTERALGLLHQATKHVHQALAHAGANRNEMLPMASMGYAVLGNILYEQYELDQAAQYLQESIRLDRHWENYDNLLASLLALESVFKAQGRSDPELTEEINELANAPNLTQHHPWVAAFRVRLALTDGDLETVAKWAARQDAPAYTGRIFPKREEALVLLGQFKLLTGAPNEALQTGLYLLREGKTAGSQRTQLHGEILSALGFWQKGDPQEGFAHLKAALAIAQPQNFISPFVEKGDLIADLLAKYLEQFPEEFPQRLLFILRQKHMLPALAALTEREREVVALILRGESNVAIAEKIYVAPSTVKKHIQNIYAKLHIGSRQEAIVLLKGIQILQ